MAGQRTKKIQRLTLYLMGKLSGPELDELHNELHRRGHVVYNQPPGRLARDFVSLKEMEKSWPREVLERFGFKFGK